MTRFSKILFLAENSIPTDTIASDLSRALALATNHEAELVLATTMDARDRWVRRQRETSPGAELNEQLRGLLAKAGPRARNVRTKVLECAPTESILNEVKRNAYDLVIGSGNAPAKATHRHLNTALLDECPCPVWITREVSDEHPRVVLVALEWKRGDPDHERLNQRLMESGIALAIARYAELHVVHAWQSVPERVAPVTSYDAADDRGGEIARLERAKRKKWLTGFMYRSCSSLSDETFMLLRPKSHLICGEAPQAVAKCARDVGAGVVIMGTEPQTGITRSFDVSTAREIFDRIECGALLVKPDGAEVATSVEAEVLEITGETRLSA